MRRVEREGFAAMLAGLTEEDNPYEPGDAGTDYDQWLDGWYFIPKKKHKALKKRRVEE
jgi:hypothetical protein